MGNKDQENFFAEYINKFNEEIVNMGHVNLVIAGKTGVGKSTLVNASFREDIAETGVGEPVTEEIRMYSKEKYPLRIYDTMGLELSLDRQEYAVGQIKKLCDAKKETGNKEEMIHAMWYCVHGNCARFEPYEEAFINEVSKEMPVIIVLTQCIIKSIAEELKSEIEKRNTMASNVFIVRAKPYFDDDGKELQAFGVVELVEHTYAILPQSAQKAWANVQKASLKIKQERARAVVIATATASFGEGYMPLPFSDCVALVPTQIGMIAAITAIYGLQLSQSYLTGIVSSLVGTTATTFAGRILVANILKLIPVAGSAVGGTISGSMAALLTTALGSAYIVVMNKVFSGEITQKELESGAMREELSNLLKEKLKLESKKNK
ncbi:MAG: 50S ribosome-binding GTPase [Lachnospiraceae bacterium]|nr:50S ribosome-binding GTPase [Lachnospiraceae bacterium]